MIRCLVAFGLIALFSVSLFGWGTAFRRLFHLPRGSWPATATLGMAVLVSLGGLLNLFRLARPTPLAIVALLGICFAVPALDQIAYERRWHYGLALLFAVAVLGFSIVTLVPPQAYNYHDDYQKYFAHVVRMVETGTVYGSPLSAIGSQTLGGQAFLQGFLVAYFPIAYVNGFDAVFALFLCLMLASEFSLGDPGRWLATLVSMLLVLIIDPQSVNTSSLYSGVALMLALAVIWSDPRERPASSDSVATGLLFAALVAVKSTFALFPLLVLVLLTVQLGVRWGIRTGLYWTLFLAPWILLHSPRYVTAFLGPHPPPVVVGPGEPSHSPWLSFDPLSYGVSVGTCTLLMAAIGVAAWLVYWMARKRERGERDSALSIGLIATAGIAMYLVFVFIAPWQAGYRHALRYSAPVAIAMATAVFGLAARQVPSLRSRWTAVPAALAVAIAALFPISIVERAQQAITYGSTLAFSWLAEDADFIEYSQSVLHGGVRDRTRALLSHVPPGEPVIAWIDTPFYLDYARNPIYDLESAGLTTSWANPPSARYLLWEYGGVATETESDLRQNAKLDGALDRLTATRTLAFLERVRSWAAKGQVLYDDGERKVIRLADSP